MGALTVTTLAVIAAGMLAGMSANAQETINYTYDARGKTEHEVPSHVRGALAREPVSGPAAVDPDNRYRQRAGINFRRVGHDTDTLRVRHGRPRQ